MKAMKKVFAMLLALAMIVTAVPVNSASAATYNMKAGSAGIISKTLYAGRSHTLKLNGYKASQIKSTKWSVGKTSVVKLASTTKTTAKMTCVGKGYTVVTAKMTLTNKKVKTFKAKITVKNPSVSAEAAEVAVGKTAQLAVVAKPTNAKLAYASDNTDVATVSDQGIVTGVKAGTANVTVTLTCGTKEAKATAVVTVKEAEPEKADFEMTSLVASKVNTLVATFAGPVDATAKVEVTKEGQAAAVSGKETWNADRTELTYVTDAKLTKGTYTVKVTVGEASTSRSYAAEDQGVAVIEFLSTTALTSNDKLEAYAYYDVKDQYGESLRSSTSLNFNTSAAEYRYDRATGKITFWKDKIIPPATAHTETWNYSDKIFVTVIYEKTGKVESVELTVGLQQVLDTVEVVGFVKKGSTTLIKPSEGLPADFKDGTYFLVYVVKDQNGNILDADSNYIRNRAVTFTSHNPLVISEIGTDGDAITINGEIYNTALITRGTRVSDGADVTIEAIALGTGNKTPITIHVGPDVVLAEFKMSMPNGIIAEGEQATIPFEAYDQKGEPITSFVSMAKQVTFNTLTFQVNDGRIKLSENNDGTASLVYRSTAVEWSDTKATDGIDRPVNITSVVTGGNTSSLMLGISDRARPVDIKSTEFPKVFVEGGSVTQKLKGNPNGGESSIVYIDQYGREIANHGDNGFFDATKDGSVKGEFNGYVYGVRAIYLGNEALGTGSWTTPVATSGAMAQYSFTKFNSGDIAFIFHYYTNGTLTNKVIAASNEVRTVETGENLKFEIVRALKPSGGAAIAHTSWEAVSTAKTETTSVVDIKQVKNISVNAIAKQYVVTSASALDVCASAGALNLGDATTVNANILSKYGREVGISGQYNGISVSIPKEYYNVSGKKVTVDTGIAPLTGLNKLNKVIAYDDTSDTTKAATEGGLEYKDLYDVNSPKGTRKDGSDVIKVKVYELFSNGETTPIGTANITTGGGLAIANPLATALGTVALSDAAPKASAINGLNKAITLYPTTTAIQIISDGKTGPLCPAGSVIVPGVVNSTGVPVNTTAAVQPWGATIDRAGYGWQVVDQYGIGLDVDVAVKISDIKEGDNNYAENNFAVSGNDSADVTITGAERTDTFKVTVYVVSDVTISAYLDVTVGADVKSYIDGSGNSYRDTLLTALEAQRKAALGIHLVHTNTFSASAG